MSINEDEYINKLKNLKKKTNVYKLPSNIYTIIEKHNLRQLVDVNARARIFLTELYKLNLKGSTVTRYFNKLKDSLFKDTTINPNISVFDDNYKRPIQNKASNFKNIKKLLLFIQYDLRDDIPYKWPIVLSMYSGLRLSEVCGVYMSHLHMLSQKKSPIPLKRKNNKDWDVIYYDKFNEIINWIIENNMEKYKLYSEYLIDSLLFPYTPRALHEKLKEYYCIVNHHMAPIGFGLHTIRYYLASILYNDSKKIEIPQTILGHTRSKTTELYIRQNNNREEELEYLTSQAHLFKTIKGKLDG